LKEFSDEGVKIGVTNAGFRHEASGRHGAFSEDVSKISGVRWTFGNGSAGFVQRLPEFGRTWLSLSYNFDRKRAFYPSDPGFQICFRLMHVTLSKPTQ